MDKRINRREQIIDCAAQLFLEKGYTATSIRQIAAEVGCTEAAIYYHFKQGKRELFYAVIDAKVVNIIDLLGDLGEAESIQELFLRYSQGMRNLQKNHIEKYRWLIAEFPDLQKEERKLLLSKQMEYQRTLAGLFAQFVEDQDEADALAWTVICAGFGHMKLFDKLGLNTISDFTRGDLFQFLSKKLCTLH